MTSKVISDAITNISAEYIEKAADYTVVKKARNPVWVKWAAMAACLCLVVIATIMATNINKGTQNHEDLLAEAVGFQMKGVWYYPITFEERKEFNLVSPEDIGLSEENKYIITKEDLGEQMGVIEDCPKEALIGLPVYHFASWAEDDRICIVDACGTYAFYVGD